MEETNFILVRMNIDKMQKIGQNWKWVKPRNSPVTFIEYLLKVLHNLSELFLYGGKLKKTDGKQLKLGGKLLKTSDKSPKSDDKSPKFNSKRVNTNALQGGCIPRFYFG